MVVEFDQRPHHPERGVRAGELESAAHVEGRGFQMLLACGLGVRGAAHHHDACDGFMRLAELEVSLTEIGMLGHPLFVQREHLGVLAFSREVGRLGPGLQPIGRRRL